ncbi:MAG: ABC transporter permease, partial [Bacteroidota bacterium]
MNYFRSHLAVAFRSIRKSPMMTSLMVLSLSIAVAVSAILLSFIQSEAGVNRDLARSDQQYVLKSEWKDPSLGIPFTSVSPLPMALAEQYPHLVANGHRLLYGITSTIGVEEHFFMESIQISDPKLFEIYEIPLVFGDQGSLLEDPDAAVISTTLAKKLFGSTQVMGELIRIKVFQGDSDPAGYRSFRITGVWDEIPYNSVIDFGATNYQVVLGPGALESFANPVIADSWEFIYAGCFVELAPGITPGDLAQP